MAEMGKMSLEIDPQVKPGNATSERRGTILVHAVAIALHVVSILLAIFGNRPWLLGLNGLLVAIQGLVQANYNSGRAEVKATAISLMNSVASQVSKAPLLLLPLLLIAGGCGSHAAAQKATASAQVSLAAYQQNVSAIVEAFIGDWRKEQIEKADALADAAIRAETDAAGKASAKNIQLIEAKRLEHYRQIEARVIELRSKFVAASKDAANAMELLEGLQGYWQQRASSGEVANQASEAAMKLIGEYLEARRK